MCQQILLPVVIATICLGGRPYIPANLLQVKSAMGDCGFGKFDKPVFIITFVAASLGVLLSPLRQGGLLHIYRPLNLEALKIGSWKLKNLEISVKIWRLTIIYILGGYAKKWPFFGVEHDRNTRRVSIYSKSAILICTKMSR